MASFEINLHLFVGRYNNELDCFCCNGFADVMLRLIEEQRRLIVVSKMHTIKVTRKNRIMFRSLTCLYYIKYFFVLLDHPHYYHRLQPSWFIMRRSLKFKWKFPRKAYLTFVPCCSAYDLRFRSLVFSLIEKREWRYTALNHAWTMQS